MNTLYEIDANIMQLIETGFSMSCVDEETGEIDETRLATYLEALQLDRKTKIENIAVLIKDLEAQSTAIKDEEKKLKARREARERKADRLKEYIKASMILQGDQRFETARVSIAFRKSKQVVVANPELLTDEFITIKTEQIANKTAIKQAIESGVIVDGAYIEEKSNLQIK